MVRLASTALVLAVISFADTPQKDQKREDMSNMSPQAHAPLFQGGKSNEAGVITDRITSQLPKPASATGRMNSG